MKTLRFNLSRMLLIFAFGLIPYYSLAQDVKPSKQEKKELEKEALNANFHAIDTLLERKTFVLEADFLQDRYGNRVYVLSTVNFIKVESPKAVLQTGTSSSYGSNGVGGTTAVGTLENFKVVKNFKKLSYIVSFTLMTNIGIYDILMNISADSNATATISGINGDRLSWDGHFKNIYDGRFFQGQETVR
jgi:hypothetical protein